MEFKNIKKILNENNGIAETKQNLKESLTEGYYGIFEETKILCSKKLLKETLKAKYPSYNISVLNEYIDKLSVLLSESKISKEEAVKKLSNKLLKENEEKYFNY